MISRIDTSRVSSDCLDAVLEYWAFPRGVHLSQGFSQGRSGNPNEPSILAVQLRKERSMSEAGGEGQQSTAGRQRFLRGQPWCVYGAAEISGTV